ncbi:GNAT family N-acetyltransferase [Erythrobacter sp. THAF29]|uniref:GNAT family N-acetyltransferase n=1 Tax=Erythrobacter sp. THAF29 TaxID=2587851 RepID=UPI001561C26F|nr:GNAT family N-acetyltransferase [Erythrobacter sp. THAF29]
MADAADWALRTFRSGDLGHIAARQAALYDEQWGWGRPMEAMIYDIAGRFLREFKSGREQCWVAEHNGKILGGVFICDEGGGTARLRLLYVEPEARGLGIGMALVRQCTQFAREVGYDRIVLMTHAVLDSARKLYVAEGYTLAASEEQDDFGRPETTEHWVLEL